MPACAQRVHWPHLMGLGRLSIVEAMAGQTLAAGKLLAMAMALVSRSLFVAPSKTIRLDWPTLSGETMRASDWQDSRMTISSLKATAIARNRSAFSLVSTGKCTGTPCGNDSTIDANASSSTGVSRRFGTLPNVEKRIQGISTPLEIRALILVS